jgi:hypothetical protein
MTAAMTALARTGHRERAAELALLVSRAAADAADRRLEVAVLAATMADGLAGPGAAERAVELAQTDPGYITRLDYGYVLALAAARRHPACAERIVDEWGSAAERVTLQIALARAFREAGDDARAAAMIDAAEAALEAPDGSDQRVRSLTALAAEVAAAGDDERAAALARFVEHEADGRIIPQRRMAERRQSATALAAAGRQAAVRRLVAGADTPDEQFWLSVDSATAARDDEHSVELIESALALIGPPTTGPGEYEDRLGHLAAALAGAGRFDRADALVRELSDPAIRARALLCIARELARAGDRETGRARADEAIAGAPDRAAVTLQVSAQARTSMESDLPGTLVDLGEYDRAEALVDAIADRDLRHLSLATLARRLADADQPARAEAVARAVPDVDTDLLAWCHCHALCAAATAWHRGGHPGHAAALLAEATSILDGVPAGQWRTAAVRALVETLAATGRPEHADRFVTAAADGAERARLRTLIAEYAEPAAARRMVAQALREGPWTIPLTVLGRLEPDLVATIAAERFGRAGDPR